MKRNIGHCLEAELSRGENFEEAVVREVKEETNMKVLHQ